MDLPLPHTDTAGNPKAGIKLRVAPLYCFVFIVAGVMLVVAFEEGHLLPAQWSVGLLFGVTLWGLWQTRLSLLSPLTRLMILLYFLPFLTCLGYLFDPNYTWWYTPLSIEYMSSPGVTPGMLMVGLIGLLGLLAGMWLARARAPRHLPQFQAMQPSRTLNPFAFCALLGMAFFFSYINTPTETIYSAVYSAATGLAGQFNFNAASLVAYTLLVALYIDSEREIGRRQLRLFKRLSILIVTVIILIFFQLLRGDRDSFGLVVGLAALYLTEPRRRLARKVLNINLRRYALVGAAGGLVLIAFLSISVIRRGAALGERKSLTTSILQGATREATWTAVLLTNLSLAAQYHEGRMVTENGLTYLDYLYSLPPGFVTRALGIQRPIESFQGPNFWFTDISSGGLHIVTVPFKNFHAPGVLLALIIFGYLIGRSEIIGQNPHWPYRLWYGTFFVASAQWFWYGDMPFIRGVMSFGLVAVLYSLACRVAGLRAVGRRANLVEAA